MSTTTINIFVASDLHIGQKNITKEIIDNLLVKIKENLSELDLIILAGDETHTPTRLGSDVSSLLMDFLLELNSFLVPVLVVKGTASHVGEYTKFARQLGIFKNIQFVDEVSEVNFKTISGRDLTILCVPEEYIPDQFEYYADTIYNTSGKKWDIIVGHGTVDGFFMKSEDSVEKSNPRAPVFKVGDLWNAAPIVLFGHYHISTQKRDGQNFFEYIGSWSAMDFSDTGDTKKADMITLKYDFGGNLLESTITPIINDKSPQLRELVIDSNNVAELFRIENYTNKNLKLIVHKYDLTEGNLKEFNKLKSVSATVSYINDDFKALDERVDLAYIDEISGKKIPEQIEEFVSDNYGKSLDLKFITSYIDTGKGYEFNLAV